MVVKKRKKISRPSVVSFAAVFSVVSQSPSLPTKGALRDDPKNGCEGYFSRVDLSV